MAPNYNPDDPESKETRRLAKRICDFLRDSGEPYENQMRMLFIGIGQHSFEPSKAEWLIAELHENIAHIRGMVLQEPGAMGFFTPAELEAARKAGSEVVIVASERAIRQAMEVFAGTDLSAGPDKQFARIWFK